MSDINGSGPKTAIKIPVSEFLREVFQDDVPNAWVAFGGDQTGSAAGWRGVRVSDVPDLDACAAVEGSHYYSVGIIKPGTFNRTDANWQGTPVIVIDDVQEKADPAKIIAALGEPSYILQSSNASQQFGYLLNALLTDPLIQARIMKAITLAFFKGIDPGHRDLTRYVRLPAGVNDKPKRITENGGTAPPVYLVDWHPERKFDAILDIAMALGDTPGLTPGMDAWTEAEGARPGTASTVHRDDVPRTVEEAKAKYLPDDYILAAFDRLGMVKGYMQGSIGYVATDCPFERIGDTVHTKQDQQTGWNPVLFAQGTRAFKCQHTDAGCDPSNEGIEAVLRRIMDHDGLPPGTFDALKAAADAARHAKAAAVFAANPLPPEEVDADDAASQLAAALKAQQPRQRRYQLEWEDIGDGPVVPEMKFPAICSFVSRGAATILASASGLGKSQFALALAMAITADPAAEPYKFLGDTEPFRYTGDVLLIENEDAVPETKKRRHAWVTHTKTGATGRPHRVDQIKHKGFVAAEQLDRNGVVTLTPEMEALGAEIARRRQQGGDVALVIFDTANSVFAVAGENDNRAMGQVYNLMDTWSAKHDVATLIIQHVNKDSTQDGRVASQNDIRGASAQAAAVRGGAFVMRRLDPKIAAEHPGEEWVTIDNVKSSYTEGQPRRVFKRVRQLIKVRDRISGAVELTTAPVLMYDPNPPTAGPDTSDSDVLCNALGLLERAAVSGAPLTAATRGGDKHRRANYVIGQEAGRDSAAGAAILTALRRKGWAEIGSWANARGTEIEVWRVTAEGKLALDARNADVPDIDGPAHVSTPAVPEPAAPEPAVSAPVVSAPAAPEPVPDTDVDSDDIVVWLTRDVVRVAGRQACGDPSP